MLGLVATMRARPGAGAELLGILCDFASAVVVSEPGNRLYQPMRSREDADVVVVLEIYESGEAFDAHMTNPAVAEVQPRMSALLAETPTVSFLDGPLPREAPADAARTERAR